MQNIKLLAASSSRLKLMVFPCALVLAFSSVAVAGDEEPLPPPGAIEIDAPEPHEISGVAAVPDEYGGYGRYAVVGDEDSKIGRIWPGGAIWRAGIKGQGNPAKGLESVDVGIGPNERELWLVLGENNRTLSNLSGVNYQLPKEYEDVCGRGLEGLAVRWINGKWQVAVLWEGGYFDKRKCENVPRPGFAPPRVAIFEWVPGKGGDSATKLEFELKVPTLLDNQKFRAPDLAWLDDDSDRLIVLLGSTGIGGGRPFNHTWLQVFDLNGNPVPDLKPFKLEKEWCEYGEGKNWEALDHSLDRSRLVMGFDAKRGRQPLVVFPSPFRK